MQVNMLASVSGAAAAMTWGLRQSLLTLDSLPPTLVDKHDGMMLKQCKLESKCMHAIIITLMTR
jgi:hypothetical protein